MKTLITFLLILITHISYSQSEEIIQKTINYIASNNPESELDLSVLTANLADYLQHPINLNKSSSNEIENLYILSALQIQSLEQYKHEFGQLAAMIELQRIPNWDLQTIELISPFITISSTAELNNKNCTVKQIYSFSKDSNTDYLGNSLHLINKLTYKFNAVEIHLLTEKDAGEKFTFQHNKGFDFYSANMQWRKKNIRLIIGDYQASFGQGLVLWSSFSLNESPLLHTIVRGNSSVKPSTTMNEQLFLRGGTLHFTFKNIELFPFISIKQIDGNIDTLNNQAFIKTLYQTGYHRTINELKHKHSATELIYGLRTQFNWRRNLKIGVNCISEQYSLSYEKNYQPYNQFDFRGKQQINASIDHQFNFKNMHFSGEFAWGKFNHSFAIIQNMVIAINKTLFACVSYRNYAKSYSAFYTNAFSTSNSPNNETGIFLGLNIQISSRWSLSSYINLYHSKWLKYRINNLNYGQKSFIQLNYSPSKKTNCFIRIDKKEAFENNSLNQLTNKAQLNIRCHIENKLNEQLTYSTRIEWLKMSPNLNQGILSYHEFDYLFKRIKLNTSIRYTFFQTTNYDSRIYSFENSFTGNNFTPYFGKGSSLYFFLRYRLFKQLKLENKFTWNTSSIVPSLISFSITWQAM